MSFARDIKHKALELGFDIAGITDTAVIDTEQVELLAGWLKADLAGQMRFMHRNFQKRITPAKLLEQAQSVICVGLNYKPPEAEANSSDPAVPMGRVANFARYEDYHLFIKKRLHKLVEFIESVTKEDFSFRICVDSAPVAERAIAARAGLGFIGKNHMLINPELGPQIFLGEIITTLNLQTDGPSGGGCSGCDKCIAACPTGALRSDGQLDAGRCISYLTIEYKGQVPAELAEKIGNRLFGCDECVLVCPFTAESPVCKNKRFRFHYERARLNLNEIITMNADLFEERFADSAIRRSGLERLKRNARICLANSAVKRPNNKSLA